MRFLRSSAVLILSCGTVAALGQSTSPAPAPSATASKAPVDLTGFKEHIEEKNKTLNEQVTTTKAIVKKNAAILEDAKRISADNLRLQAERKLLDAQNAEFARESQAMQSETTGVSVPTPPPAAPAKVEPVAPAPRVEPPPAPPARIDTAAAPVAPQRAAPVSAPPPAPAAVETASAPRVEAIAARPAPAPSAPVAAAPVASVPAPAAPQTVNDADAVVVRVADPGGVTLAVNAPLARPVTGEAVAPADSGPIRVSAGVSQGMLLSPIRPTYPAIAITAHVEGAVVMEAIISKEGTVASVRAVSGPQMLQGAALDAVRGARYHPYFLNGQPTEVAVTIRVVFQLNK